MLRVQRRLLILLGIIMTCPLAAGAVVDSDRILVINNLSETLTLVDRAGGSVTLNARSLGLVPNRIRLARDKILVVNSISDDLWVINATTLDTLRTIRFPDGDNPWDVAAVNDTLCVVSMLLADRVIFVNHSAGRILDSVPVGVSPEGMLTAVGRIWVANTGFNFGDYTYGQGSVSVINASTHAVIATIPVGTNPQSLALSPDGTIHVVCTGNYADKTGIVYILSASGLNVTDSISMGGMPGDLVIAPDGTGYLAAGGWADSGLVFRYNALTHDLLNGVAHPWHSARGVTAVLPRLEGGVYTLCFDADSVIEHRLDGTIAQAWQVGDGPQAVISISNRIPGDLSEDGATDVFDVIAAIDVSFSGGTVLRPNSADVNADCTIDVFDVIHLITMVFGWETAGYWGCVQ